MSNDDEFMLRRVFAQSSRDIEEGAFSIAVMQRVLQQQRRRWITRCCVTVAGLLLLVASWLAVAPELSRVLAWFDALDRSASGSLTGALSLPLGGLILWRAHAFRRR